MKYITQEPDLVVSTSPVLYRVSEEDFNKHIWLLNYGINYIVEKLYSAVPLKWYLF
jgi:hypothetical protein